MANPVDVLVRPVFFFFQAEDGIRDKLVTGVQTCALPIFVDGAACFVVDAKPATERQAADSGYSRRKIWIRKDHYVTVKREFYDRQDRLEKVETNRKLVNVAGTIWRSDELEMHDVQNGTRTLVTIESRAINRGLRDDFFSEAELIR